MADIPGAEGIWELYNIITELCNGFRHIEIQLCHNEPEVIYYELVILVMPPFS
jgi:hypothetical protein